MGPPFAASYPARLLNTAEVLSLARSAGLDVLQPAYQNFVSSLSSFEKTAPEESVKPSAVAPCNINQPLALLAAAAATATGSDAALSAESLLMALPLKMAAVEEGHVVGEADDYPGGASVIPTPAEVAGLSNSQHSFNAVLGVAESARIAVVFAPPRRSSRSKQPTPRYQPPASGSGLK
jgi:hypothetical protein